MSTDSTGPFTAQEIREIVCQFGQTPTVHSRTGEYLPSRPRRFRGTLETIMTVIVKIPRGGVVFKAGPERTYVEVKSGEAILPSDGQWLIEWRNRDSIHAGLITVTNGSVAYGGDHGIAYRRIE